MANWFSNFINTLFSADSAEDPPLTDEQLAAGERFLFEIFAQQKARAMQPVSAVLFSPRLRRRNPNVYFMDQAMSSLMEKGWVEMASPRLLMLTDVGYQRMQFLGIAPQEQQSAR